MYQAQFSHNPLYCVDIIKTYKPDFTPRVAFILGSGLGALADQIENAVAISYEKLPGFPVSTVHGHAGELVLGYLQGVPVVCMKGRGHFYEGRGMTIMTDAIRTFKLLGCELLFIVVVSCVTHLKIPTVFTWVTPDLISTCMRMAPTVLRIV
jgi:xanthosine phosphorylase